MNDFVALDHLRFKRVDPTIFTVSVVADCMSHRCSLVKHDDRVKLDACCQYGADTDLGERDAILTHREQISALLVPAAAAKPWFTATETADADFASGAFVRTQPYGDGCIFLQHDGRGCAIHRASIEGGWDFRGVKPHVCRLFPLTYDSQSIILSDDYRDYSCANTAGAPSVYRVSRDTIADIFGVELVAALDAVESTVVAQPALVSLRASL